MGAKTGRDGLAGAAFASRDLTEESKEDRPAVQVGDPFMEKLLMEACLELFEHPDAVVGVQDMGAAGLTCSTIETASRGGSGVEVDLDKVPQRETGMTPYEIMLSESQERMLIIVKKGRENVVRDIFAKWDLDAAEIGFVTDTGRTVIKWHGNVVADVPSRKLADDAPVYQREAREPAGLKEKQSFHFTDHFSEAPDLTTLKTQWLKLLGAPSLASKAWIYRQYDHQVGKNTVLVPGSDAAVIRIEAAHGKERFIAMAADCNGRYCSLDPRRGAMIAVAESARNCTMTGALPIGSTDNLNFGNPHDPEIFWQLRECVEGLAEACRGFQTPVTGGNVSLYNQSPLGAIDPTPVMAMVGLIEKREHITRSAFQQPGDDILLVGGAGSEMGASAYLYEIHGIKKGRPPEMDLQREKNFQDAVRSAIHSGGIQSAHDLSDGGLAVALAECCLPSGFGAELDMSAFPLRPDLLLFNETQGRALLSCNSARTAEIQAGLSRAGVEVHRIGSVTDRGKIQLTLQHGKIDLSVAECERRYEEAIPSLMK